jgi:hypothetical protein
LIRDGDSFPWLGDGCHTFDLNTKIIRPMPTGIYLEREALLDRIQFCDLSARTLNDDLRSRVVDFTEGHLAYAKARLEHVNRVIAGFEAVA